MTRALRQLWVQVLVGIAIGIALGVLAPAWGVALKPVADGFVKLVKMLLAPIIFGTVAVGIAQMGNLRDVGRLGLKALVYFEVSPLATTSPDPRRPGPNGERCYSTARDSPSPSFSGSRPPHCLRGSGCSSA